MAKLLLAAVRMVRSVCGRRIPGPSTASGRRWRIVHTRLKYGYACQRGCDTTGHDPRSSDGCGNGVPFNAEYRFHKCTHYRSTQRDIEYKVSAVRPQAHTCAGHHESVQHLGTDRRQSDGAPVSVSIQPLHQVVCTAVGFEQVRYPLTPGTSESIPTNGRTHVRTQGATDGSCRAARCVSTLTSTRVRDRTLARSVRAPLVTRARCRGIGAPTRGCAHTSASTQDVTKSFAVGQPCGSTSSATTAKRRPTGRGRATTARKPICPTCRMRRQSSAMSQCPTMRRSYWKTTSSSPRVAKPKQRVRLCTPISRSAASGHSRRRSLCLHPKRSLPRKRHYLRCMI